MERVCRCGKEAKSGERERTSGRERESFFLMNQIEDKFANDYIYLINKISCYIEAKKKECVYMYKMIKGKGIKNVK